MNPFRTAFLVMFALPLVSQSLALAGRNLEPPNVIIIVIDDVGYGDVGYNHVAGGGTLPDPGPWTPRIDDLAADGAILDQFYTAPMCSATRMALMTGRYPIRWGMQRTLMLPSVETGMPREQDILPEMMERGGIPLSAMFGKWHLGHGYSRHHPMRQGFDDFYGNLHGGVDYYTHRRMGEYDWRIRFTDIGEAECGQYHTTLVGTAAMDFLHGLDSVNEDPFFLYIPFFGAHGPCKVPSVHSDIYCDNQALYGWDCEVCPPAPMDLGSTCNDLCYGQDGCDPCGGASVICEGKRRAHHWGQVTAVDETVGFIMDKLFDKGFYDNTVVWFMSDNGGGKRSADNGGLREGKLSPYQGGIRVPSFVWFPGEIEAGRVDEMITCVDVAPTLRGLINDQAGQTWDEVKTYDGEDMSEFLLINGQPDPKTRTYPVYLDARDGDAWETLAMIETDSEGVPMWKYVLANETLILGPNPPDPVDGELYNLKDDSDESDPVTDNDSKKIDLFNALVLFRQDQFSEDDTFQNIQDPDSYPARPQWAFIDVAFTSGPEHYLAYQLAGAPPEDQTVGTVGTGGIVDLSDDDVDDFTLDAIGYHVGEDLLYGLALVDGVYTVYQIDSTGLIMRLGPVPRIPASYEITGGDYHVDSGYFWVYDDAGDQMLGIELGNLTVAETISLKNIVDPAIGDIVFHTDDSRWAYDNAGDKLLRIGPLGVATEAAYLPGLGPIGALWASANGGLVAYKESNTGDGSGPYDSAGLYDFTWVGHSVVVTPIWAGPEVTAIDGAGCISEVP